MVGMVSESVGVNRSVAVPLLVIGLGVDVVNRPKGGGAYEGGY